MTRCTAGSTPPRSSSRATRLFAPKIDHKHHKIKVLYTLNNTGPLTKVAPPCPKKGVIGKDQEACVDYKQSFRRDGDLFLPFLFNVDMRGAS